MTKNLYHAKRDASLAKNALSRRPGVLRESDMELYIEKTSAPRGLLSLFTSFLLLFTLMAG